MMKEDEIQEIVICLNCRRKIVEHTRDEALFCALKICEDEQGIE